MITFRGILDFRVASMDGAHAASASRLAEANEVELSLTIWQMPALKFLYR